jgi:hypothetical protein
MLETSDNVVVTGDKQSDHIIADHTGLGKLCTHNDHQIFTVGKNPLILRHKKHYNVEKIKEALNKKWREEDNYSDDKLRIAHMPTAIVYFDYILEALDDPFLIFTIRNPYAIIASIMRVRPETPFKACILHVGNLMRLIKRHTDYPPKNALFLKYEFICAHPDMVQNEIIKRVPELSDMDMEKPVSTLSPCVEDFNKPKIPTNYNKKTISFLRKDQIEEITETLQTLYNKEMDALNYRYIT